MKSIKRLLLTGMLLIYTAGCTKDANIDLEGVDEVFLDGYKVKWGGVCLFNCVTS